jgi:plastocyanin
MSPINLTTVAKVVIGMSSRSIWFIALSALVLGLMLSLTSCSEPGGGLGGGDQDPREEAASPVPEDIPTTEVGLTEYQIEMPASLSAGPQTFRITNNGTTEHNFEVEGQGIEEAFETNLDPGVTQTMQLDLAPGTYEVYCPVGDHREQGMEVQLTVTQ